MEDTREQIADDLRKSHRYIKHKLYSKWEDTSYIKEKRPLITADVYADVLHYFYEIMPGGDYRKLHTDCYDKDMKMAEVKSSGGYSLDQMKEKFSELYLSKTVGEFYDDVDEAASQSGLTEELKKEMESSKSLEKLISDKWQDIQPIIWETYKTLRIKGYKKEDIWEYRHYF